MANQPDIPELPETLRDIATKLYSYGFTLSRDSGGTWFLTFPEGDPSGLPGIGYSDADLGNGLLLVLRQEERQRNVLQRYEQFDARWGKVVYGNHPGDSTIAAAGCGPTSLAIVLQYLLNNGSRPRPEAITVTPLLTAKYAATHGRVSGKGTAGDPMIDGLQNYWRTVAGSKVTLQEASDLLEEGKLIIFLSHGCKGYTRHQPLYRDPNVSYSGHYMVLAGIDEVPGPNQIYFVLDPGRNESRAMCFIKRHELAIHAAGLWWVYEQGELETRVCQGP